MVLRVRIKKMDKKLILMIKMEYNKEMDSKKMKLLLLILKGKKWFKCKKLNKSKK